MKNKFLKLNLTLGAVSILFFNISLSAEDRVVLPPSWTTTRVTYNTTVEELSERYYGNKSDYKLILEANKKILRGSHIVTKNMEIRIPITPKFRDQPEKLGWND